MTLMSAETAPASSLVDDDIFEFADSLVRTRYRVVAAVTTSTGYRRVTVATDEENRWALVMTLAPWQRVVKAVR